MNSRFCISLFVFTFATLPVLAGRGGGGNAGGHAAGGHVGAPANVSRPPAATAPPQPAHPGQTGQQPVVSGSTGRNSGGGSFRTGSGGIGSSVSSQRGPVTVHPGQIVTTTNQRSSVVVNRTTNVTNVTNTTVNRGGGGYGGCCRGFYWFGGYSYGVWYEPGYYSSPFAGGWYANGYGAAYTFGYGPRVGSASGIKFDLSLISEKDKKMVEKACVVMDNACEGKVENFSGHGKKSLRLQAGQYDISVPLEDGRQFDITADVRPGQVTQIALRFDPVTKSPAVMPASVSKPTAEAPATEPTPAIPPAPVQLPID